jgi:hypothetical protein
VSPRAKRQVTLALAALTLLVLFVSIPPALRDAYQRGGIRLFCQELLDDIPRRLAGPGRMRFVVLPAVAILFGIAAGRRDAKAGSPPYLLALAFGKIAHGELLRSSAWDVLNLVLLGVLLDAVAQRIILGEVHPVVALLAGPVLVTLPYATARALAKHLSSARNRPHWG